MEENKETFDNELIENDKNKNAIYCKFCSCIILLEKKATINDDKVFFSYFLKKLLNIQRFCSPKVLIKNLIRKISGIGVLMINLILKI